MFYEREIEKGRPTGRKGGGGWGGGGEERRKHKNCCSIKKKKPTTTTIFKHCSVTVTSGVFFSLSPELKRV